MNYCQSRRMAAWIRDSLTVVGRRRRGSGCQNKRRRVENRDQAATAAVARAVIDSCHPSPVESFTRTKVDIAAPAALLLLSADYLRFLLLDFVTTLSLSLGLLSFLILAFIRGAAMDHRIKHRIKTGCWF